MKQMKLIAFALAILLTIPMSGQKIKVDAQKSMVMWTGKKVTGQHHGTIQLSEGWMNIENNKITDGYFSIDMATLVDDDLEGAMKAKLEGHLKSDDFFGVEKHPKAMLKITGSEPINKEGFKVMGDLTIKGKTHPITFTAKKLEGKYTGQLIVDRTLYDVRYGSDKFFDNLGDKVIYDEFTLDVVLQAK